MKSLENVFRGAALALLCSLFSCDRPSEKPDVFSQLVCRTFADCSAQGGVRFGIIGDSWTDIIYGTPLVKTLRTYLEQKYDYRLVGATLGGRKLRTVLDQGLHFQVIDKGGGNLAYMLISLGGNDLKFNSVRYLFDPEAERRLIFGSVKNDLLELIRGGNLYKTEHWGGEPMLWIVHGYDYTNPDNPLRSGIIELDYGCRTDLVDAGFTNEIINTEFIKHVDLYNEMLMEVAREEPYMRYIDLRGTLGGPPYSHLGHMLDCIHPNDGGFELLTDRYVSILRTITGDDR